VRPVVTTSVDTASTRVDCMFMQPAGRVGSYSLGCETPPDCCLKLVTWKAWGHCQGWPKRCWAAWRVMLRAAPMVVQESPAWRAAVTAS
jgi:hypothetical protein